MQTERDSNQYHVVATTLPMFVNSTAEILNQSQKVYRTTTRATHNDEITRSEKDSPSYFRENYGRKEIDLQASFKATQQNFYNKND